MVDYAEVINGVVHAIGQAHKLPKSAPGLLIVDITGVNPKPKIGWKYQAETGFESAAPAKQAYVLTRNNVRALLSLPSQIKFDKLGAMIESPGLTALVPAADDPVPGMPGVTQRDLLRTTLAAWMDASTIRTDDQRFIDSIQLLVQHGIIAAAEAQALLG